MKKSLSILLTFALLLGLFPATAFAEEPAQEPLTRASFCQLIKDGLDLQYDDSMAIDINDIPSSHPNYQAVVILVKAGVFDLSSSSDFYPSRTLDRDVAAFYLFRLGLPSSTPTAMPSDVVSYSYYYEAVASVLGLGIMKTDAENLFHPNSYVYSNEIDLQALRSMFSATTTGPAQMDLAKGSIEISENIMGVKVVTQGETSIRTADKNVTVRQSGSAPTSNTITHSGGEITLSLMGVNIDAESYAISLSEGAVLNLNLVGDNITKGGVEVSEGASLTIEGTGVLNAEGKNYCGGISNSGTVTINGGTVAATGGYRAAGIGGGSYDTGGSITITGGNITAIGGSWGAGIGGGDLSECFDTITITGGTVTATGGDDGGAGIGCGLRGSGGKVTIKGGDVTATGRFVAIGGGWQGYGSNEEGCDSITIDENANLTLTHTDPDGFDVFERIFDLELPESTAAHLGNVLGLSTVARSSSGIASYQWQTSPDNASGSWSDVEGQTSAAYTVPMTAEQDGHYFRCKITNVYGNVAYTNAAQGFVLAFKSQPQSVETGLNQTAALSATATCTNVAYRWQRSYDEGATWADVPGENFSTLLVSTTQNENGALYRCVITAANGDELASDSARITLESDEQTYTVRYYQENADGSGYTVVSQDVLPGETGQQVTAPAKTFEGFTENPSKGSVSGTITGSGLILSRYFDRNTYQITFDTNGGAAIAPLSAKYEAVVQAPTTPSRYGYAFDGWYADPALTQAYEFTTMPLNGAAVYAKWIPKGQDRGTEYRIEELNLRDAATYEILSGIPSGDFLAEATVTNLSSTETDTILLVTYDKDGKMLGMSYLYANPKVGQTITLGTKIQNSGGQVGKVKALVLPNLASPIPLANAVERN